MLTTYKKYSNLFMSIIYEKRSGNLVSRIMNKIKAMRFVRSMKKVSPTFGLLWQMAIFVKLAEEIFFYDNNQSSWFGIYSSRNYNIGTNGFIIFDKENECNITVKLYSETEKVILEVKRNRGEKLKNSFTFVSNKWENNENNMYNEMLLEQCIKIINNKFISLFKYCYGLR